MAVKTGGGLRTISWSITEEQYNMIRSIVDERRKSYNRVSQSDIAREVIAAGLEAIGHADNIASTASEKVSAAA